YARVDANRAECQRRACFIGERVKSVCLCWRLYRRSIRKEFPRLHLLVPHFRRVCAVSPKQITRRTGALAPRPASGQHKNGNYLDWCNSLHSSLLQNGEGFFGFSTLRLEAHLDVSTSPAIRLSKSAHLQEAGASFSTGNGDGDLSRILRTAARARTPAPTLPTRSGARGWLRIADRGFHLVLLR